MTLEWGTGMKRTYSLVAAIVAIAAVCVACGQSKPSRDLLGPSGSADQVIAEAFRDQRSGLQVAGEGVVTRVLPDDNDGGRNQRFILRLASGQTLLVAHNIDVAPPVGSLAPGDSVQFSGVYEWNSQGGVIHWTHHDPAGQHAAGWLRVRGETFQ